MALPKAPDPLWKRAYLRIMRELTIPKMIFYTLLHGGHVTLFAIGWWLQANNAKLAGLNTLTYSVWLSRGAGLCLSADATLLIWPMCRNLLRWVRPKLRWLPLDETQWFHRQVAYSMLVFTTIHTTAHYVNFFNVERYQLRHQGAVEIHYTQVGGITGHVMLLCMLLMYTTAHVKIRTQSFETFWYTHHLFVPFLLALYTHATGCFVRDSVQPYSPFAGKPFWDHCIGYQGWRWELWGGALYFLERIYREIRSRRATFITRIVRHPENVMELQFHKPSMRYKAGQWLFINIPSVSRHQWHPFTITSCPFDPYISIHIRQVGDWTRNAGDALGCGPAQAKEMFDLEPNGLYEVALQPDQELPAIRIDGAYGAPAEDVFDNEIAVVIGTGIGVTPWASILKNIYHLRASPNPPRRLRRVEFFWVQRDVGAFEWFQRLLESLEYQSMTEAEREGGKPEFLRIHTYLTQKMTLDQMQNIAINSVGTDRDPLTELQSRTNFGRPPWKRLFKGMAEGLVQQSYMGGLTNEVEKANVGVYFCGPNKASKDIEAACKAARTSHVNFRFWKEHF